jgi:hypothetical protein
MSEGWRWGVDHAELRGRLGAGGEVEKGSGVKEDFYYF